MCMLAEAVGSGKKSSSILISSLNIGASTLPLRKGPKKEELDSDLRCFLLPINYIAFQNSLIFISNLKKIAGNLMLL